VHNSSLVMKYADLDISPPIGSFGLFDWHQIDKIVDVGYQYARKKLEEWKSGQV
jgi:predicted acylesterase/phospholipase RssA